MVRIKGAKEHVGLVMVLGFVENVCGYKRELGEAARNGNREVYQFRREVGF